MSIPINIGVEDNLSEVVVRRLLDETRRGYVVKTRYPTSDRTYESVQPSGYGILKKQMPVFNEIAQQIPFFVLTDLDNNPCAAKLATSWLRRIPLHPNFIFRVAIREVEAWILADRENIASFLGIRPSQVPPNVESLPDPKREIIALARTSRFSDVVSGIAPAPDSLG